MTKRIIDLGLCIAVILSWTVSPAQATDRRLTPLVQAVQLAKDSVVNIHSEKTAYSGESLFGSSRGRKVSGMGTGIVIDERGYIVTNHHVIDGVDSLRCTLADGSTFNARVISYDRSRDLAIVKIDSSRPLKVMPIGTSSDLMLGESVFAVGNAFGYEHTVTSGIVSALARNVEVNEKQAYHNLIQTDASINPGNSGGPLLNLDGHVIGINVAIRAGAQRIGFAIPIDDARRVIAKLLNTEELNSTTHGLVGKDVKTADAQEFRVVQTLDDSPAAAAGFEKGDVVVKVDDIDILDAADFERALLERAAGEQVEVTVRRDGELQALPLVLAASNRQRRMEPEATLAAADTVQSKSWSVLGIELEQIPANQKNTVGPRYRGGMRVARVRPGSPAAMNGMRNGDILVGLHIWETLNEDNVSYVLDHPQLTTFSPLKFYIVRAGETLYGHLPLTNQTQALRQR